MKKGLVKVKCAMPDVSPVLVNKLGAAPVNRQAAKVFFRAPELCKPMPSEPDLADRKTVIAYLRERQAMQNEIHSLKLIQKVLNEESSRLRTQVKELKQEIAKAKIAEEPASVVVSFEQRPEICKLSTQELRLTIEDIRRFRLEWVDQGNFNIRVHLVIQEILTACEVELRSRNEPG